MVNSHCPFLVIVLIIACLFETGDAISCDSVKFASISLGYPVYYGECSKCYAALLSDSTSGSFYVNCTSNRIELSRSPNCSTQNITQTLPFSTKTYACVDCALVRLLTASFGPYSGRDYLLFNYTSADCLQAQGAYWYLKKVNETGYEYHLQDNCLDAADSYYHGHVICIPSAQAHSNKTNDGTRSISLSSSTTMQMSSFFAIVFSFGFFA